MTKTREAVIPVEAKMTISCWYTPCQDSFCCKVGNDSFAIHISVVSVVFLRNCLVSETSNNSLWHDKSESCWPRYISWWGPRGVRSLSLSVRLSVFLSVCPSVYPPDCSSVRLSVCVSVWLCVNLHGPPGCAPWPQGVKSLIRAIFVGPRNRVYCLLSAILFCSKIPNFYFLFFIFILQF